MPNPPESSDEGRRQLEFLRTAMAVDPTAAACYELGRRSRPKRDECDYGQCCFDQMESVKAERDQAKEEATRLRVALEYIGRGSSISATYARQSLITSITQPEEP